MLWNGLLKLKAVDTNSNSAWARGRQRSHTRGVHLAFLSHWSIGETNDIYGSQTNVTSQVQVQQTPKNSA